LLWGDGFLSPGGATEVAIVLEGLDSDRISFQRVQPGPFPFPDQTFDIVFSKDSMIHIPDKPALYIEVLRILRPGGTFVASDWLQSEAAASSATMREFYEVIGLTFNLETPDNTHRALHKAGFIEVALRDRHAWHKDEVHRESWLIRGSLKSKALELLGAEAYEHCLEVRRKEDIVLDKGELRPTHLRARRPG
jgi:phosphoethanolamine N-methyltransferase